MTTLPPIPANTMNLAKQLKAYLKHTGMTAAQLSRKTGVPNATISDWLAGRKPRDFEKVRKVAEVFEVSVDHLVFGSGILKAATAKAFDGNDWVEGIFEVKFRPLRKTS